MSAANNTTAGHDAAQSATRPSPDGEARAFSDDRVFVVSPDDKRLGMANWPATGGIEQIEDGPTYMVIGRETSDEKCARLAKRYNLSTADLIAFREAQ